MKPGDKPSFQVMPSSPPVGGTEGMLDDTTSGCPLRLGLWTTSSFAPPMFRLDSVRSGRIPINRRSVG